MKRKDKENIFPVTFNYKLPIIEMTGNKEIIIEGSTGVLKYQEDNIKINTRVMVISVKGRGLKLKYLSSTALIIEGCVLSLEYIM